MFASLNDIKEVVNAFSAAKAAYTTLTSTKVSGTGLTASAEVAHLFAEFGTNHAAVQSAIEALENPKTSAAEWQTIFSDATTKATALGSFVTELSALVSAEEPAIASIISAFKGVKK